MPLREARFKVGDRVRCSRNLTGKVEDGLLYPLLGSIYTVRAMERGLRPGDGDNFYLYLEEIHNKPRNYGLAFGEASFYEGLFEPASDYSTDISVFKHLDRTVFNWANAGGNPNDLLERGHALALLRRWYSYLKRQGRV